MAGWSLRISPRLCHISQTKRQALLRCRISRPKTSNTMRADLITATVPKMLRNPSLMPSFTALHHVDYKPPKRRKSMINRLLIREFFVSYLCFITQNSVTIRGTLLGERLAASAPALRTQRSRTSSLTITQAAAFISQSNLTLIEYLDILSINDSEIQDLLIESWRSRKKFRKFKFRHQNMAIILYSVSSFNSP